jgi:hypothetical protein
VVVPAIRQALDQILDAEREWHKSELLERTHRLELAVAKLASALAQLQLTLATERGQTRSAIGTESARASAPCARWRRIRESKRGCAR